MKKLFSHSKQVYLRLFHIWQIHGVMPFAKTCTDLEPKKCPQCGRIIDTPFCPQCGHSYVSTNGTKRFFKGSFDSIPFLNDDAKRTFMHLLLRPGYMIRDYLKGLNSRYMAPMTSLIIFYAFFALISSIISPEFKDKEDVASGPLGLVEVMHEERNMAGQDSIEYVPSADDDKMQRTVTTMEKINIMLNLDRHPEYVDSKQKASVAAVESALRSQGVSTFLWRLIALTIAIWLCFRRKVKVSLSASATISSYILCQFCFFNLLALLITWGHSGGIGTVIMGVIMIVDFCQLFGFTRKQSLRRTLLIGLAFVSEIVAFMTLMWLGVLVIS